MLSKLLALGGGSPDRIRASTGTPAARIGRTDLGRLVEGGEVDVAALGVERGQFDFTDVAKAHVTGTQRLACRLLARAGKVVWDRRGPATAP